MTDTNFMVDCVYRPLFTGGKSSNAGRARIAVADFVEITGYDGDDPATALASRVKPAISMVAHVNDNDGAIAHRPFTFGGCVTAEWVTNRDEERTHLVVTLVAPPVLYDPTTGLGRIPTTILRKATDGGNRKLAEAMRASVANAVFEAPEGYFDLPEWLTDAVA